MFDVGFGTLPQCECHCIHGTRYSERGRYSVSHLVIAAKKAKTFTLNVGCVIWCFGLCVCAYRHFVRWANALELHAGSHACSLPQQISPLRGDLPMWACYPMGRGLHVHVYVRSLYNILCEGHSAGIASCANEARQSWWMGVPTGIPVLT